MGGGIPAARERSQSCQFCVGAYDPRMTQKGKRAAAGRWIFVHPFGVLETKCATQKKRGRRVKLGPVVAEKSFNFVKLDGTTLRVSARLGKPFAGRKSNRLECDDYFCPAQIVSIGNETIACIGGEDPFAALRNAMEYLRWKLGLLADQYDRPGRSTDLKPKRGSLEN